MVGDDDDDVGNDGNDEYSPTGQLNGSHSEADIRLALDTALSCSLPRRSRKDGSLVPCRIASKYHPFPI
jgi:hypothetical protein